MPLNSHGSTPYGGWTVRRTGSGDLRADTFGVELETSRGTSRNALGIRDLAELASPAADWWPETDGSITGPEFVSYPATLDYWRSIRPSVAAMLAALRAAGAGTVGAGCHVNIGRDAFSSAEHLARFIRLVESNPRFSTRMAGRSHDDVRSWAKFSAIGDIEDVSRNWFLRTSSGQWDRYCAVNLQNADRVEFRLPAGVISDDKLMAHIEWTASMVEYTRDALHPATFASYCRWIAERPTDFPEAFSRMVARFPARFPQHSGWAVSTATPATPTAPSEPEPMPDCGNLSYDGLYCVDSLGHPGLHQAGPDRYWGGTFGSYSMSMAEIEESMRGSRTSAQRDTDTVQDVCGSTRTAWDRPYTCSLPAHPGDLHHEDRVTDAPSTVGWSDYSTAWVNPGDDPDNLGEHVNGSCGLISCTGLHRSDIIHTPGTLPLRCATCAQHPAAADRDPDRQRTLAWYMSEYRDNHDPDAYCSSNSRHRGYICTRPDGHRGYHGATDVMSGGDNLDSMTWR